MGLSCHILLCDRKEGHLKDLLITLNVRVLQCTSFAKLFLGIKAENVLSSDLFHAGVVLLEEKLCCYVIIFSPQAASSKFRNRHKYHKHLGDVHSVQDMARFDILSFESKEGTSYCL